MIETYPMEPPTAVSPGVVGQVLRCDRSGIRTDLVKASDEITRLVTDDGKAVVIKANMWAISSDTHQLDYVPKHHFIIIL